MANPHPDYYELAFARSALRPRLAAIEAAVVPGSTVLDLGCNDGRISRRLLRTGLATRVLGIDVCDVVNDPPEGFTFLCGDLASLDLARFELVDVVLLLNIVHHLVADSRDLGKGVIDQVLKISPTILCDMGSFSEYGHWAWRQKYEEYWRSDEDMWDDLFEHAYRTPLLCYAAQVGGQRVLWRLEPSGGR